MHIRQLIYHSSIIDIIINYLLIILNASELRKRDILSCLIIIIIQLSLLQMDSNIYGVSLIWCGFLGLIVRRGFFQKKRSILILMNIAVLTYYYYRLHPISTIAHMLSFIISLLYLSK